MMKRGGKSSGGLVHLMKFVTQSVENDGLLKMSVEKYYIEKQVETVIEDVLHDSKVQLCYNGYSQPMAGM